MPPSKKTERFEIRLSPAEKKQLEDAGAFIESGDVADLVRRSSMFIANTVLEMIDGEFNLSYTNIRLIMLLSNLIENPAWKKVLPEKLAEFSRLYPDWNEEIYGEKPSQDEARGE